MDEVKGSEDSQNRVGEDQDSNKVNHQGIPWVEKHRPQVLADVVGNEETITRLQVIAKEGNMPNFLLAGPPGTGKTTSILCLARQLLGPELYKKAVLELNASDARGIDVVRNEIKQFAQNKVILPKGRHKIVILDEADSMMPGAQQALRRIMESFSNTTRFALACNASSQVIEPIQSRCAILRFTKLADQQILKRVKKVMDIEHVDKFTMEGLNAIVFSAQGDMRYALNNLQATWTGMGTITEEAVFKVVDQPQPVVVQRILEACAKADIQTALKHLQELIAAGYAATDIVGTVFRVCRDLPANKLTDSRKLEFIREIGFTQMRINEGLDTPLQLSGLVAKMCLVVVTATSA